MRKSNPIAAICLALAASTWSVGAFAQAPAAAPDAAPADAAPAGETPPPAKKPMHHRMTHHTGKLAPTAAGDKAVEDLNDASLNAAKTGKPFTAPTTPEAAKQTAHAPTMMKKKHMAKKAKPAADDAAAPADSSK